jgi:hypothetical protein
MYSYILAGKGTSVNPPTCRHQGLEELQSGILHMNMRPDRRLLVREKMLNVA